MTVNSIAHISALLNPICKLANIWMPWNRKLDMDKAIHSKVICRKHYLTIEDHFLKNPEME